MAEAGAGLTLLLTDLVLATAALGFELSGFAERLPVGVFALVAMLSPLLLNSINNIYYLFAAASKIAAA
jgi:hypothetical protein